MEEVSIVRFLLKSLQVEVTGGKVYFGSVEIWKIIDDVRNARFVFCEVKRINPKYLCPCSNLYQ